jgi:PST family polysaccharide transporter
MGSFLAGIVVVRLVAQEEYGTFAVGLVVLSVLLSMNELGVSVAVVQHRGDVRAIAPTVMTLSVVSSAVLAAVGYVIAPHVARLMGTPNATGLIRLLVIGVVLDGIASVPNALLSRLFLQRRRLQIDLIAFGVGTPVTIGLAVAGYGAWSLGWGAVVGNGVTAVLALVWSPVKVRPGWDPVCVRQLLRFGLPLAGASLLALLMLNIDYIVVGHTLGTAALGLYLLAFNLCSWPITVVTSAIRRVAVALFARLSEHADDGGAHGFGQFLGLALGLTLPMCVLLAAFAQPLIQVLYGERWTPAALALAPLAVLSLARVSVEVTYDFLAGSGRTRATVWLHGIWLTALLPALVLGARLDGIRGVAVAHAVIAVGVVLPTLWLLLRRSGIVWTAHARSFARQILGAALMILVVVAVERTVHSPVAGMLIGGPLAAVAYGLTVWPLRHDAVALWNLRTDSAASVP